MNTRTAHRTLEHLRILNRISQCWVVAGLGIAQFRRTLDSIGQVHLQAVGQTVGDGLTQCIRDSQRHFLHTRHILD